MSTVLRYPTIDCQWSVPAGQVSCECKEAKFNLSEEWRPAHCWCDSKNACACHMLPYPYRLSLALAAAGTVRSGIHLKMRPKQVERHQANEYDTMKCSPLAEIPEVVWLRWLPRSSPKRAQNIECVHNGTNATGNCKNLGAAAPFSRELRNRSRRSGQLSSLASAAAIAQLSERGGRQLSSLGPRAGSSVYKAQRFTSSSRTQSCLSVWQPGPGKRDGDEKKKTGIGTP